MFVEGFSASTDVFNRAAPLLGFIFLGELLGAGQLDWTWWQNVLAVLGGLAVILVAMVVLNLAQGRPVRAIPNRIGKTELAAFVILPALLPLIFGGQLGSAATTIAANLLILLLIYAVFVYGLLAILRWVLSPLRRPDPLVARAAGQGRPAARDLRAALVHDQEMWQIFAKIGDVRLRRTSSGSSSFSARAFLLVRVPLEARRLEREAGEGPPLTRAQRFNVGLVLFVSQALQVLFVSLTIGLFFVLFGMLAVNDELRARVDRRARATPRHGSRSEATSSSSPRSSCAWPAASPRSRASTLPWRC